MSQMMGQIKMVIKEGGLLTSYVCFGIGKYSK